RKDPQEVEWLRKAQTATEGAIRMACELVASAEVAADGGLRLGGEALTSERVRYQIDVWLLQQGFVNHASIVAGGPSGGDCHDIGAGPLRTGEPVIIDVFPRDRSTRYHGDCTRTVVHGVIPPEVQRMHATVVQAKRAAIQVCRAGVTGAAVHAAAIAVIQAAGYGVTLPPAGAPASYCGMVHGTGHGIGLEVHEPPLLAEGGPELLEGDALTIEPGLYCHAIGGIRVEDMVIVRAQGCENLNRLPEGLTWT
ncbi:MAG TPA: M24 family metallopeptidase, partial [Pirellulaceae bacterium]